MYVLPLCSRGIFTACSHKLVAQNLPGTYNRKQEKEQGMEYRILLETDLPFDVLWIGGMILKNKPKSKSAALKKAAGRIVAALLVAGLCAGCGMQAKSPETNDSVKTEKEKKERKELLSELALRDGFGIYVTERCVYKVEEASKKNELVQFDWQGKEQHRISFGEYASIEGISEKYVCYSENGQNDESILYLAPIEQTEKGEKVQLEKKEKIAMSESEPSAYVWESNVYYILDSDRLYYYDAAKKESKCLLRAGEDDIIQFCHQQYEGAGSRSIHNGKVYLTKWDDNRNALYCIDQQTAKLEFLGEVNKAMVDIRAVKDHLVFCDVDDVDTGYVSTSYIVYDTKEKEIKTLLDEKQIRAFLEQQGLWKEGASFQLVGSRDAGEQLSFVIRIDWPEKVEATGGPQKGKKVEMSKSRYILLRCPWQELTALSYDKKFSKWMDEHIVDIDVFVNAPPTANMSSYYVMTPNVAVWNFYGEELLLCCMDFEKKDMTGEKLPPDDYLEDVDLKNFELKAYDPENGKIRDIPKSDMLYQIIDM